MSGTATPTGAEPVGTLSASGSYTGEYREMPIASGYGTGLFYGDFIKAKSDGTVVLSQITTANVTGTVGIFVGCRYTDPNSSQPTFAQQWTKNTVASDAVAFIADAPFLLFKMQADEAVAANKLFLNIRGIDTGGSTLSGRSANALDGSATNTSSGYPFRIIEFVDGPRSAAGDDFTDIIVMFTPGNHAYRTALGV